MLVSVVDFLSKEKNSYW